MVRGKRPRLAKFVVCIGRGDKSGWSFRSWCLWLQGMPTLPHYRHGQSHHGASAPRPLLQRALCREARVACLLHGHPPSPPSCHCCVLFVSMLTCSPSTAFTNIARAAPNPDHTLFSRLCLSACTCHGSLQGTVQTACSALSPAPASPVTRSTFMSAGPVISRMCV